MPSPAGCTVPCARGTATSPASFNGTARRASASDELDGRTADGALRLRFDTIRSIARRSGDSSLVTLLDGREIALSGTREVGDGNRGIYVDDARYGRVLVSWAAFERIDFSAGGSGPAYTDFAQGRPLTGSVTTRGGRRLTGRLVYDLDESETTETLDAPSQGVDYTIPLGLIASIAPVVKRSAAPARESDPPWRRGVAARSRRRSRRGERRHADLRRRPRAPRVRGVGRHRAGRFQPAALWPWNWSLICSPSCPGQCVFGAFSRRNPITIPGNGV